MNHEERKEKVGRKGRRYKQSTRGSKKAFSSTYKLLRINRYYFFFSLDQSQESSVSK
jgi:hypothetical protein